MFANCEHSTLAGHIATGGIGRLVHLPVSPFSFLEP
jgi:hypothetical protein